MELLYRPCVGVAIVKRKRYAKTPLGEWHSLLTVEFRHRCSSFCVDVFGQRKRTTNTVLSVSRGSQVLVAYRTKRSKYWLENDKIGTIPVRTFIRQINGVHLFLYWF